MISTINDLYREFVDGCGHDAPTKTLQDVQDRYYAWCREQGRTSRYEESAQDWIEVTWTEMYESGWPWQE